MALWIHRICSDHLCANSEQVSVFADARVVRATASCEKAGQSAQRPSNNDTRMSAASPLSVPPGRASPDKLVLMSTGNQQGKFPQFPAGCPLMATVGSRKKMSCNCHIRIQSVSLTHTQTRNTLSSFLGLLAARARIYPLGEPKSKDKICYKTKWRQPRV